MTIQSMDFDIVLIGMRSSFKYSGTERGFGKVEKANTEPWLWHRPS